MSSLPPCVLSIAPPGKARTFVARVQAGQESFATFGTAQLVLEASAFATIRTVSGDFYFVITAAEANLASDSIAKQASRVKEITGDADGECRSQTQVTFDGVKMKAWDQPSRSIGTQSSQTATANE